MSAESEVTRIARDYYDSSDADEFYFRVWGGEDIHVGIYQSDDEDIRQASRRTVERMAEHIPALGDSVRMLDCGAGYGGAARHLAATHGCQVDCLNLSKVQNERNRQITEAAGLSGKIRVFDGAFESLPFEDDSYDVVWSQDSFLHSGDKPLVLKEVARVLKPGGRLVFTDPMQADDCPDGVLGAVLARIHLDAMGSFALYRQLAQNVGLREVKVEPMTEQLVTHYGRVQTELTARRPELAGYVSAAYIDRMIQGLQHWVDAGRKGHLAWGIMHFES